MVLTKKRGTVALIACALLIPVVALATAASEADRIEALEARVASLEAQLESILSTNEGEIMLVEPFAVDDQLTINGGHLITVTGFETGGRFRYSPANGFSTLSLSAKPGYRLLCLYVTIENAAEDDLYTGSLLDAVVSVGKEYSNKAQDSFFYVTSRGNFAGGLKAIGPGSSVEGCLLFAVPDDIESTGDQVSVRLTFGNTVYECVLKQAGALLEPSEIVEEF